MIFKKKNIDINVFKYLKNILIFFLAILIAAYLGFLFVVPHLIKPEKHLGEIKNELKKYCDFELVIDDLKLKTTPDLKIELLSQQASLLYKDKKQFIQVENPSVKISLLPLMFGAIQLDKVNADTVEIDLIYLNNNYTFFDYIKQNKNTEAENDASKNFFKLYKVKSAIKNLVVKLDDKKLKKIYYLKNENLNLSHNKFKNNITITSKGESGILDKDKKFIDFNIKLSTKLPEKSNGSLDKGLQKEAFLYNPFEKLDELSFYSDINVDLKIDEIYEKFSAKGLLKIDKISIKKGDSDLLKGQLSSNFYNNQIDISSNLFLTNKEYLTTTSNLHLGKSPKIYASAKTNGLTFSSIKNTLQEIMNILNIENNLAEIKATGDLSCDFKLESDYKKIKSSGGAIISNGVISNSKMGLNITQINSILDLSNNKIDLRNTSSLINGSKFEINGHINTDSKINIKAKSQPINIINLAQILNQLKIIKKSQYQNTKFNGGLVTVIADITGDLKSPIIKTNIEGKGINIEDKKIQNKLMISNFVANIEPKLDFLLGSIKISGIKNEMKNPNFKTEIKTLDIDIKEKTIESKPFLISAQNSTLECNFSISDYLKKPDLFATIKGRINPQTVLSLLKKSDQKHISYLGNPTLNAIIKGNFDNINIGATAEFNKENYIAIAKIKGLEDEACRLNLNANFKKNLININSINLSSKEEKIIEIKGGIENYKNYKNLVVSIPKSQNVTIYALDNLNLNVLSNLVINSSFSNPKITGTVDVSNLLYDKSGVNIPSGKVTLKKDFITIESPLVKIGSSDFAGTGKINNEFSSGVTIDNILLNSTNLDTDELTTLLNKSYTPKVTGAPTAGLNNKVNIKNGKITAKNITAQKFKLKNMNFDFKLNDNIFSTNNFNAQFADGVIEAEIEHNLKNTKTNFDGTFKAMDFKKATEPIVGAGSFVKSGNLTAIAKLDFLGTTQEQQLRTLNGQISFNITNGQLSQYASLENFLHASNLLSQGLMNLNLNNVISAITNKDTGEFEKLQGSISLSNGWANINDFISVGKDMSLYASGKYNILTTNTDLKLLGRISSSVVQVLGPLGSFSINKAISKINPKGLEIIDNIKSMALNSPFFASAKSEEIKHIPELSEQNENELTKDFQVIINGPIARASSIKSFKWVE